MKRKQLPFILVFLLLGNYLFSQSGPPAPRVINITVNIINLCDWQVPIRFEQFETITGLNIVLANESSPSITKNGWIILEPSGSISYSINNFTTQQTYLWGFHIKNTTTGKLTIEALYTSQIPVPTQDIVITYRIEWDNDFENYRVSKDND